MKTQTFKQPRHKPPPKIMEDRMQASAVFGQWYPEVMAADKPLKANCWTHKVLITHCNQIIDKFLRSNYSTMDTFLRDFTEEEFRKDENRMNYAVIFFLSLEYFSNICFEADILRLLFSKYKARYSYAKWWQIRDTSLLVIKTNNNPQILLSELFINPPEINVLAERVRGDPGRVDVNQWVRDREEDIKIFRKEIRNGNKENIVKLEKYESSFKLGNGHYTIAPIAYRLALIYFEDVEKDRKKRALVEKAKRAKIDDGRQIEDDDVIMLDDDGDILQKTKMTAEEKLLYKDDELYEQERKALVEEIQRNNREANIKRELILKTLGLLKTLDPLFVEGRDRVDKMRKKLLVPKKLVQGENMLRQMVKEVGLEGNAFFHGGSKVLVDTHPDMIKKMRDKNAAFANEAGPRSHGYANVMSKYRDEIWDKVDKNRDLFKKTRVGKTQKMHDDFDEMNEGIEADRLNQSDYNIKRDDLDDLADRTIYFDDDVQDVIMDEPEAKFLEMLKELRDKRDQSPPPPPPVVAPKPPPRPQTPPKPQPPPRPPTPEPEIVEVVDHNPVDILPMDPPSPKHLTPKAMTPEPQSPRYDPNGPGGIVWKYDPDVATQPEDEGLGYHTSSAGSRGGQGGQGSDGDNRGGNIGAGQGGAGQGGASHGDDGSGSGGNRGPGRLSGNPNLAENQGTTISASGVYVANNFVAPMINRLPKSGENYPAPLQPTRLEKPVVVPDLPSPKAITPDGPSPRNQGRGPGGWVWGTSQDNYDPNTNFAYSNKSSGDNKRDSLGANSSTSSQYYYFGVDDGGKKKVHEPQIKTTADKSRAYPAASKSTEIPKPKPPPKPRKVTLYDVVYAANQRDYKDKQAIFISEGPLEL